MLRLCIDESCGFNLSWIGFAYWMKCGARICVMASYFLPGLSIFENICFRITHNPSIVYEKVERLDEIRRDISVWIQR